jgi:2-amino-4-hydroxy-6-hydroxymethyldihydropteridine diphosphokinase
MIILSLGSNLDSSFGNRADNLNLSIAFLEGYGIKVEKKSSFYETPSYPDKSLPKYLNAIIIVKTELPIVDLMSVLIHIESKLERVRSFKNDPRTCDIDIIDFNGEVISYKYKDMDLKVPHKELSNRNFVLIPLNEVVPNWRHPVSKVSVSDLIKKLSEDDRNSILKV